MKKVLSYLLEVFHEVGDAFVKTVEMLFHDDMNVMTPEARKILSNPIDRAKYEGAVRMLRQEHVSSVTIELTDGTEITLIK